MTTGIDIFLNALTALLACPLADDAIYTPASGPTSTIKVLFYKEYVAELGMEGYHIWLETLESNVTSVAIGETYTIRGTVYKIKSPPQKKDDGLCAVELSID